VRRECVAANATFTSKEAFTAGRRPATSAEVRPGEPGGEESRRDRKSRKEEAHLPVVATQKRVREAEPRGDPPRARRTATAQKGRLARNAHPMSPSKLSWEKNSPDIDAPGKE
jgi:hypothetical protein